MRLRKKDLKEDCLKRKIGLKRDTITWLKTMNKN